MPFIVMYVSDWWDSKKFSANGEMLRFIPDCYKNQKMCDKAVDNHFHALEFVPIAIRLKSVR